MVLSQINLRSKHLECVLSQWSHIENPFKGRHYSSHRKKNTDIAHIETISTTVCEIITNKICIYRK